jgi:hypothetical protein
MMIRARLRLKALGVCALVLALTALASASAKAETGAEWLVEDKFGNFIDASELKASVVSNGFEGGLGSLLTKILGMSVTISCTAFELVGVKLEGNGSITKGSKGSFTGCTVSLNGTFSAKCKPHSAGDPEGTIRTSESKGLIVLHALQEIIEGKKVELKIPLVRVEPSSGETLATINMGAECPIGELVPVRGKLTLEDSLVELSTVVHFFTQSHLTDLWVLNKNAEHSAATDGTGLVKLGGEHSGRPWDGFPA